MKILILALSLLLLACAAQAAELDHQFVAVNTNQTTTSSTFSECTGATIASGNFTAGKKYLIFVTAHIGNTTGTAGVGSQARMVHGSTVFDGSTARELDGANIRQPYEWMGVWTAVGGEAITLQFASSNNSDTVNCNFVGMMALNLSDDLTENTDWFYNERTVDDTLSSTPTDGGTVTFTPAGASDWLVCAYVQFDGVNNTDLLTTILDRSGEATSTTPSASESMGNSVQDPNVTLCRVYSLTAASNTFTEKSSTSGTVQVRLQSSLFALNLNKFRNHGSAYTEADTNLSATDYATNAQTLNFTPDLQGPVWIVGGLGFDRAANTRELEYRLQIDGSDDPAGQTTANYQFDEGNSNGGEWFFPIQTYVSSMTAAAHTINLDASSDQTTSTPTAQQRFLMAVSMELAAAAARPPIAPIILQ